MHADTDAIRTFANAGATHADELAAIAATLTALPVTAAAASFGPVGAPFLAAIADNVADETRAVAALSRRVSDAGAAASASADAYDDADARAGARVSSL